MAAKIKNVSHGATPAAEDTAISEGANPPSAASISGGAPACRAGALPTELIALCENLEVSVWGKATVVEGLPKHAYHGIKGQVVISSSQERDFNRSMELFHGRHIARTIPGFSSSSTELGDDIHAWWEVPEAGLDFLVCPPTETLTPTGLIGKKAEDWAKSEGITGRLVSPSEKAKRERIVNALRKSKPAMELNALTVHRELSFFWQHTNGLDLRCSADGILDNNTYIDLKTTSCDDIDREFFQSVRKFGYARQQAFYEICQEATGGPVCGMVFVIVQTDYPHQVRCRTIPEALVQSAKRSVLRNLDEIKNRLDLDHWVSDASDEIQELFFPRWALTENSND
jgi:hypothetical protein